MSLIQPTRAEPVSPNAVFSPSISLSTVIRNGKLVTSAMISLTQAEVQNYGLPNETWKRGIKDGWLQIDDIGNLPQDLADLQADVNTLYAGIVQLLAAVNAMRQIV